MPGGLNLGRGARTWRRKANRAGLQPMNGDRKNRPTASYQTRKQAIAFLRSDNGIPKPRAGCSTTPAPRAELPWGKRRVGKVRSYNRPASIRLGAAEQRKKKAMPLKKIKTKRQGNYYNTIAAPSKGQSTFTKTLATQQSQKRKQNAIPDPARGRDPRACRA